jgi:DNA-directed RNA polymerase beta' subunit
MNTLGTLDTVSVSPMSRACIEQMIEARQASVIERTEDIYAPAMGTNQSSYCTVCVRQKQHCPGHMGWYRLAHPIMNPMFESVVCGILQRLCLSKSDDDTFCGYMSGHRGRHTCTQYKDDEQPLQGISLRTDDHHEYALVASKPGKNKKKNVPQIVPSMHVVINRLVDISRADADVLCGSRGVHPSDYILFYIPVIPVYLRNVIKADSKGAQSRDDASRVYEAGIKGLLSTLAQHSSDSQGHVRYMAKARAFFRDITGAGRRGTSSTGRKKKKKGGAPPPPSTGVLPITTKKGVVRFSCLAKRVGNSGRSVIVPGMNMNAHEIVISEKMERAIHLVGKLTLLERNPNLDIHGNMGVHVRAASPDYVIRIHPIITTPYGADFDGDEMNVYKPHGALEEVLDIRQMMISSRNSRPFFGPIQDGMLGMYMLSMHADQVPHALDILPLRSALMYDTHGRTAYAEIVRRTHGTGVHPLSGPAIASVCFPPTLQYESSDGSVCIKDGLLRRGALTAGVLWKKEGSIVQECVMHHDPHTRGLRLVQCMHDLGVRHVCTIGVSMSLSDFLPDDVVATQHRVAEVRADFQHAYGDLVSFSTDPEFFRVQATRLMARSGEALVNILRVRPETSIGLMIASGSKGDRINLSHSAVAVGPVMVGGSVYIPPHTLAPPPTIEEIGFVRSSYFNGVTPSELFHVSRAARESAIVLGLGTPESGYIQRLLTSFCGSIRVRPDGTVRFPDDRIVSMCYGPVNLALTRCDAGHVPMIIAGGTIDDTATVDIDDFVATNFDITDPVVLQARREQLSAPVAQWLRRFSRDALDSGYRRSMVSVHEYVGITAGQAVTASHTQKSMSHFHTSGRHVEFSNPVTMGDVMRCAGTQKELTLRTQLSFTVPIPVDSVHWYVNDIVATTLRHLCRSYRYDPLSATLTCTLRTEAMAGHNLCDIVDAITRYRSDTHVRVFQNDGEVILTVAPIQDDTSVKNILVAGIRGIRAVERHVTDDTGACTGLVLIGANASELLRKPYIDPMSVRSNHIKENLALYGIEYVKMTLIDILEQVTSSAYPAGCNTHIRIIADLLTWNGRLSNVDAHEIVELHPSFFNSLAVGSCENVLKRCAFGYDDPLQDLPSEIITGTL